MLLRSGRVLNITFVRRRRNYIMNEDNNVLIPGLNQPQPPPPPQNPPPILPQNMPQHQPQQNNVQRQDNTGNELNDQGQRVVMIADIEKYTRNTIPNLLYEGNPHKLTDFLAEYKLIAKAMNWSDEQMIMRLPLHLKGMARQIYANLKNDEKTSWNALCAAFTKIILVEPSPRLQLNTFRRRVMKSRESPTEFAFALRTLAEGAFPNATPAQIESFLLDQFLYGIPDDLRMSVIEKSNFESAYRKAQMLHLAGNNCKVRISDNVETYGYQLDKIKIDDDDDDFLNSQKINDKRYFDYDKRGNDRNYKTYDNKRRDDSRNRYRDDSRNRYFRQRSYSRDRNYRRDDFKNRDESSDRSYRDHRAFSPLRSDSSDRRNSNNYYKNDNFKNNRNMNDFNDNDDKDYFRNDRRNNFNSRNSNENRYIDRSNSKERRKDRFFENDTVMKNKSDFTEKTKPVYMSYNINRGKRNFENDELQQNDYKMRDRVQKPKDGGDYRGKVNNRGQIQCDICYKFGHGPRSCWYNQDNFPNNKKPVEKSRMNYIHENGNFENNEKEDIEEWRIRYERLVEKLNKYEEENFKSNENEVTITTVFARETIDDKIDNIYNTLISPNIEKRVIKETLDKLIELTVPVEKLEKLIPALAQYADEDSPYKSIIKVLFQRYGNERRKHCTKKDKLTIKIKLENFKDIEMSVHPHTLVRKIRQMLIKKLETDHIILLKMHGQNLDDDEFLIECGVTPEKISTIFAYIVLPEQNIHELGDEFIAPNFTQIEQTEIIKDEKMLENKVEMKNVTCYVNTEVQTNEIINPLIKEDKDEKLDDLKNVVKIIEKIMKLITDKNEEKEKDMILRIIEANENRLSKNDQRKNDEMIINLKSEVNKEKINENENDEKEQRENNDNENERKKKISKNEIKQKTFENEKILKNEFIEQKMFVKENKCEKCENCKLKESYKNESKEKNDELNENKKLIKTEKFKIDENELITNETELMRNENKNDLYKNENENDLYENKMIENENYLIDDKSDSLRKIKEVLKNKNEDEDEIKYDKNENEDTNIETIDKRLDEMKNEEIENDKRIHDDNEDICEIMEVLIEKETDFIKEKIHDRRPRKGLHWISSIMPYLLLILILGNSPKVFTIETYDCSKMEMGTTYSLLDIDDCPGAKPANLTTKDGGTLHIYQESDFYRTMAKECIVYKTETIHHCGMHSHSSIIKPRSAEMPIIPSATACRDAFHTNELRLDHKVILKVQKGYRKHQREYIAGTVGNNGKCSGGTYRIDGEEVSSVVVVHDYIAELRQYQVSFETIEGRMMTRPYCKATSYECITDNSVLVYEVNTQKCNLVYIKADRFNIVSGYTYRPAEPQKMTTPIEPIETEKTPKVIMSTSSGVHMRFILKGDTTKCGKVIQKTNYNGIYVSKEIIYEANVALDKTDVNAFTYFNNKLDFLFHTNRKSMERAYEETVRNDCRLNKEILRTKLAIAITNPDIVTPLLPLQKGVFGRMIGEALHTYKCNRVEAVLAQTTECTNELPVMYEGRIRYAEPVTRILLPVGIEAKSIECSNVLSPIYQVNPSYWISLPGRVKVDVPKPLELVALEKEQKFKAYDSISTSGLYGPKDIDAARKYMLFPQERQRVITEMVHRAMQGDSGAPNFELLLSADHFKKATMNTMKQMWGRFLIFGQAMSGFMGLYFITTFVKVVMSQVLSTYHIHAVKGVTWKLIFGCFPFLAKYIIINHYKQMEKVVKDEKPTIYKIAKKCDKEKTSEGKHYSYIGSYNSSGSDNEGGGSHISKQRHYERRKRKDKNPMKVAKSLYTKITKPPKARPLHSYLLSENVLNTKPKTSIEDIPPVQRLTDLERNKILQPYKKYTLPNIIENKSCSLELPYIRRSLSNDFCTTFINRPLSRGLSEHRVSQIYPLQQLKEIEENINGIERGEDEVEKESSDICTLWVREGRVPCLWITINSHNIKAVIDTGSPISIIDSKYLTPVQRNNLAPMTKEVKTFTGEQLNIAGGIILQIGVANQLLCVQFAVMSEASCLCLLGVDAIQMFMTLKIAWLHTPEEIPYQPNVSQRSDNKDISSKCLDEIKQQQNEQLRLIKRINKSQENLTKKVIQKLDFITELLSKDSIGNRILQMMNSSDEENPTWSYKTEKVCNESEDLWRNELLMIKDSVNQPTQPREWVIINNKWVNAIVDTGATITIVNEDILGRYAEEKIKKYENTKYVSASNHKLNLIGRIEVPITIRKETILHTVYIMKDAAETCILGMDFLQKLDSAVIDLNANKLVIGKDNEKSEECKSRDSGTKSTEKGEDTPVIVDRPTLLMSYAETIFSGFVEELSEKDVLFEPSKYFMERHNVSMSNCVCKVVKDKIPVRIANHNMEPVKLYPGEKLGTIMLITPNEIITNEQMPMKVKPLEKIKDNHLDQIQKTKLAKLLNRYEIVLAQNDNDVGKTNVVKHTIPLETNKPIKQKPYRIPYALREECERQIKSMMENEIIRPSSSPWMSPVVLVKKKDSTIRFCVDFRKLNDVTHKDTYPLPRIDDMLDKLHRATLFTTLDLQSGYWQIPIDEKDKEKTAFSAGEGLYEFNVMPFGLTGAPATFQRCMNYLLMDVNHTMVYIDDIIIYSTNFEEHLNDIENVLKVLKTSGLKLKPSKCEWVKQEVSFLGHIVSAKGMTPDPVNTEKVRNFPVPRNIKDIQRFIGIASYYRRFIKNFATIASPLHKLTRKDKTTGKNVDFHWSEVHQKAFEELKERLVTPPILRFPDMSKPFILMTDASGYALGAVLGQKDDDEKDHVIAYASRGLKAHEKNYSTIEKELLAIVFATKQFKHYIWSREVQLLTDHRPLQWLKGHADPTSRLVRWMLQLQEFNLEFKYRTGASNANADFLSRITNEKDKPTKKDDIREEKKTKIDESEHTVMPIFIKLPNLTNNIDMRKEQDLDPDLRLLITKVAERSSSTDAIDSHYEIEKGVLKYKTGEDALYVVPEHQRKTLLFQYHDGILGGHLSTRKTLSRLKRKYFWPTMAEDTKKWCSSCKICLTRKDTGKHIKVPLKPIEPPLAPMEITAMDILGPFPETANGNKYILVFSDYFTRWPEAYAIKNQTAEVIAQIFVEHIVFRYGVPKKLLTDQGANFTGGVLKSICEIFKILKLQTSPYHPQTDGLVERFNRTLANMLSSYANSKHNDWDVYIPSCLFAYRNAVHASTKETPFFLMYLRNANMPIDLTFTTPVSQYMEVPDYVTLMKERICKVWKQAGLQLKYQQEQAKDQYDKKAKDHNFKVGDQVMVSTPLTVKGHSAKLHRPFKGPYEVVKVTSTNLQIKKKRGKDPIVVHVNRCKLVPNEEKRVEPRYPLRSRKQNDEEVPTTSHMVGMIYDYSGLLYLSIRINGFIKKAVLDTGSTLSIIAPEYLTMSQLKRVQRTDKVIRAIDGHEIIMSGTVDLILVVNQHTVYFNFMVLNNCTVNCLLGTDIIKFCYETGKFESWTVDILNGIYDENKGFSPCSTCLLESIVQIPKEIKFYYQQLLKQRMLYHPLFFSGCDTLILSKNILVSNKTIDFTKFERKDEYNLRCKRIPIILILIVLLLSCIAKIYTVESRVNFILTEDTYVILCADMTSKWLSIVKCLKNEIILTSNNHCDVCYGLQNGTLYVFNVHYIGLEKNSYNFTGDVIFMTRGNKTQDIENIFGLKVNGTIREGYVEFCGDVQFNRNIRVECIDYNIMLTSQKRCSVCIGNTSTTMKFKVTEYVDDDLIVSEFINVHPSKLEEHNQSPINFSVTNEIHFQKIVIIPMSNKFLFKRSKTSTDEVRILCMLNGKIECAVHLTTNNEHEYCYGLKRNTIYLVRIHITRTENYFVNEEKMIDDIITKYLLIKTQSNDIESYSYLPVFKLQTTSNIKTSIVTTIPSKFLSEANLKIPLHEFIDNSSTKLSYNLDLDMYQSPKESILEKHNDNLYVMPIQQMPKITKTTDVLKTSKNEPNENISFILIVSSVLLVLALAIVILFVIFRHCKITSPRSSLNGSTYNEIDSSDFHQYMNDFDIPDVIGHRVNKGGQMIETSWV